MEVALRVGTMNPRLRSITILSMLLPVVLPLCSAGADELSASSSARTFSIHDAASTLRDYCSTTTDGRLWFTMPDGDRRWSEYRRLHEIGDASRYSHISEHADRTQESFDEDFRALFGGATACYSGTVENTSLTALA